MKVSTQLLFLSWLITGIICLWAGTLVFSVTCSQAYPAYPKSGNANHDQRGLDDRESTEINRKQMYFNGGILLVAALQFLWTWRQLKTTRSELRAYVSFNIERNVFHDPQPNVPYQLVFDCQNHGETPAIDIGFVGGIRKVPISDIRHSAWDFGEKFDEECANLFPHEKMSDKGMGIPANTRTSFTWEEISEVRQGTHAWVIGLKIKYRDVFNKWHETVEYWAIFHARQNDGNFSRQVSMLPGESIIT